MGLKKSQGAISLFDVRIKSTERDVILLRGSSEEAASVVLSGNVVLSSVEAITIKRINLKLQGTLRLHWTDPVLTSRGPGSRPVKYEKIIYEHEWQNLASGHLSSNTTPNQSRAPSRSTSSVSLAALGKAKSTSNLMGLNHHQNNHSFSGLGLSSMTGSSSNSGASASAGGSSANIVGSGSSSASTFRLPEGNHEFPFEIVLPGDMLESIEGMEGGQIIYKFVCVIEKAGMFSSSVVAKKHIRIIRTVGSDSFDLSQTVSIENTWPKKVEYAISVPSKAAAIGSYTPVDIIMQPLLKGLKLGKIKVQLAEHIALSTPLGQTTSRERMAHEVVIPAPEDGLLGRDSWEIHEMVPLPTSLSKCTQDCTIGSYVKVAHKLKFAISLINPDGHTSELRASLPIYLFISPNVQITSVDPTVLHHSGYSEDTLFGSEPNSRQGSMVNIRNALGSSDAIAVQMDADAPPTYHDHIYDRVWSENPSEPSSPEASGYTTPHLSSVASRRNSVSDDLQQLGMVSLAADQRSQLAAGLRALERAERSSTSPTGSAVNTPFPLPLNGNGPSGSDYFSLPSGAGSNAAAAQHLYHGFSSPELMHMSRVGTPLPSSPGTPFMEPQELESLSRVPSYQTALKKDVDSDTELAPLYKNDTITNPNYSGSVSGSGSNSGSASGSTSYLATHSPSRPVPSHQSHIRSLSNTRNSSSTGLSFLNRNHSSRSLMEEASRLVRINDKAKNKHA